MTLDEYDRRRRLLEDAFSPFAPVSEAEVFHGRSEQRRLVVEAIRTVGRHVVIYGERGVGKTSLANVLRPWLGQAIAVAHVSATAGDTFETLIRRAFASYQLTLPLPAVGFVRQQTEVQYALAAALPGESPLLPDQVARTLANFNYDLVVVVDEFDRLPTEQVPAFADFIKSLSDDRSGSTVVIVGVAESVNQLVGEHGSIVRNLMQIHMPRMSEDELTEIVDTGFTAADCTSTSRVMSRIVRSCHGFPHYAHLIAQYTGLAALNEAKQKGQAIDGTLEITEQHVVGGMDRAVQTADQTHREAYHRAVQGGDASLWVPVVVACALASADDRGFFNSRAVLQALQQIRGQEVVQQTFAYHLGELIAEKRGPLLERTGPEKRYLYRFVDPFMRPYIIMRAQAERVADGLA